MTARSFPFDELAGAKRFAPATERNRDVIAAILADILPPAGSVLEIASGTGEHIVHFAKKFPHLVWQPSDPDDDAMNSIMAWVGEAALPNILEPLKIDAATTGWPGGIADALLCINMVHISPWAATQGLFNGAAPLMPPGAPLYLYGPYFQDGVTPVDSNLAFDKSLRARNPQWGIRNLADVEELAVKAGFTLESIHAMPANNLSLVFRRV